MLIIVFVVGNSVDPDEMPHYAAFHLGLNCLPKKAFMSHDSQSLVCKVLSDPNLN